MKTLFEDKTLRLVDNEQDYDFVGYIENMTDKTIIILFIPGDFDEDEDGEVVYDETGWEVDEIRTEDAAGLRGYAEPDDYILENGLEMAVIPPKEWRGFPADNTGRSMFNALKEGIQKTMNS